MKILVTGGAGYIGGILVPRLLSEGHKVRVVDNFMYNQTSLLECCYDPNLEIVRSDVRNKNVIEKCLKDVDVIFPLACITGVPACDKDRTAAQTINFDAVKMISDLQSKNQAIIFPTTNSGYGVGQEGIYCTEETPLNPISLYGRLKVELENILLNNGNCITLRLATVFGISPRMRLDLLVNDFTYAAVTNRTIVLFEAHFKRNYLHVRDAAKAFVHCLQNFDKMKDEPYNVGLSNANLSKSELCEQIKEVVPDLHIFQSAIGEDPDKRNYIVSNEKIERTGYMPDFSLQQGIRELVKGYQVIRNNQFTNL